jgi:hypothetical protein
MDAREFVRFALGRVVKTMDRKGPTLMKRFWTLLAPAVLLLAGAPAHADPSASDLVEWSYSWSHNYASGSIPADSPGTGGVSLTKEQTRDATGSSDVVATNLRTFSTATASSADKLNSNGSYELTITITDKASGETGTLTFTGKLSGTFTADSTNITNQFTGSTTQSITLGDNTYTVTLTSYTPPGPSTAESSGSIGAHVEVTAGGDIQKTDAPEPSSLLLSCVGLALAGGAAWRKRRQTLAVA